MSSKTNKSVIRFAYSYPYERTLLALAGETLTKEHSLMAIERTKIAQTIWDTYEKQVLKVFSKMYKIEISEKFIIVFTSLIAPNSFSRPMTITLKRYVDIDANEQTQRTFVYTVIHELAHFFAYTRDETDYFNVLFNKIININPLEDHGANLHYLIQAVEFGIIGEVFGYEHAKRTRGKTIERWSRTEYGKSAALLEQHNIPLDKTCLEYIERKVINQIYKLKNERIEI